TYYADHQEGSQTSSGDSYSASKFTAAHATIPFGTWVRVTNQKNQQAVDVKINDRIPQSSRILNVSRSAAEQLGMVTDGIASVSMALIKADGTYATTQNDQLAKVKTAAPMPPVRRIPAPAAPVLANDKPALPAAAPAAADGNIYLIQFGSFATQTNAERLADFVAKKGVSAQVVRLGSSATAPFKVQTKKEYTSADLARRWADTYVTQLGYKGIVVKK
ncbi:MAG: septal ring lytic transglycosylase RlpA family protein, partial [Verrucomicrobiota bacterium]